MSFYNIFFSPTGGTAAVARTLAASFGGDFTEIDMIKRKEKLSYIRFTDEDFVFVSLPSFGGRVPSAAAEEIKNMQGNRARVFITAVFGNRAIDDTLKELSDILEDRGFIVAGGAEAVAEHSLIHEFGRGRPDSEDKKELAEFGRKIRKAYDENSFSENPQLPGKKPYKKYGGVPMKPYTDDKCTSCGLCAVECPAMAIPLDNPAVIYKDMCISCMHCVSVCPEHARKISLVMVSVASVAMKKACSGRKENRLYI